MQAIFFSCRILIRIFFSLVCCEHHPKFTYLSVLWTPKCCPIRWLSVERPDFPMCLYNWLGLLETGEKLGGKSCGHTIWRELCPVYDYEPISTKNPVDNMLLPTWKSHHYFILGDRLSFDSINLGGGTEHEDGTNHTTPNIHMEGNITDTEHPIKNKSGYYS